jgi:DNA-directed RNA polymerase specialized sigma24 family protein
MFDQPLTKCPTGDPYLQETGGEELDQQSRDALEDAYRELAPDLWRAVCVYAGGVREVADEAVAEAFAEAGGEIGRIRDLKPWLYAVAFRIARKELKARRGLTQISDSVAVTARSAGPGPDADHVVDLMRELRRLTPNQRGALILRDAYGYSSAEAGGC